MEYLTSVRPHFSQVAFAVARVSTSRRSTTVTPALFWRIREGKSLSLDLVVTAGGNSGSAMK